MTNWKTVASVSDLSRSPVIEVLIERSVLILIKHGEQVLALSRAMSTSIRTTRLRHG